MQRSAMRRGGNSMAVSTAKLVTWHKAGNAVAKSGRTAAALQLGRSGMAAIAPSSPTMSREMFLFDTNPRCGGATVHAATGTRTRLVCKA